MVISLIELQTARTALWKEASQKEIWLNFVIYLFEVLLMIDETVVIGRLVYVIILLLPFRCFS